MRSIKTSVRKVRKISAGKLEIPVGRFGGFENDPIKYVAEFDRLNHLKAAPMDWRFAFEPMAEAA